MSRDFVRAVGRRAAAPALVGALAALAALAAWPAAPARAIDNPGGVAAPAVAVSTRGTGGTVYAAVTTKRTVSPKPRVAKKPAKRKPARKPAPPSPAPTPSPTPAPSPAPPSGAPTPAQTAAQGAFFPVRGPHSFGGPENRFGAGRVGHIHQGQDVLAAEGLSVVAPLAGTIVTTGYQAGAAGWYVAEQAGDELAFFFAHCQAGSVAVSAEQSVRAGQQLCRVGQTGDATGPHLHFEVWVGGWRVGAGYPIDPLPYLEAWDR
jgi:murein DD-endopeptidase MepM/ murein hydrolase activator NlpD